MTPHNDNKELDYIDKTTLRNGLKIVTERVESVKSISVGIWVKTGSRNESDEYAGITHFLEHMLFKGTEKRSSYDIALSMEALGGYLNAFTSSEYTCYYARCLSSEIDRALDVLSDMILHPTFPEKEIEKEKKVVLEEMKMYRDSPDDYLFEEFSTRVFEGHPLGRPVIGYEQTVSDFKREDLYTYMDQRYQPWNLLISVAGDVEHDKVVELIHKYFDEVDSEVRPYTEKPLTEYHPGQYVFNKPIEQTHLMYGRRGLHFDHQDKFLLLLANTVLGGGMSSRLHQNVREKYGYCYSINTFNQSYQDTGLFGIYVGTDREYLDHVRTLLKAELQKLREKPVPEKELEEAKSQLKGKLLLSMESMSNRMSRLAKSELYYNRFITLDELVQEIDEVEAAAIQKFSEQFFDENQFSEGVLLPESNGQEKS